MNYQDVDERLEKYLSKTGFVVVERFGEGQDGTVFFTDQKAAVKVFSRQEAFDVECECYRRLLENGLDKIGRFFVPQLIRIDESLGIIEMTPVQAPCIYDFGKCYVDHEPPFSTDQMEEWYDQQVIRWGEHWSFIKIALAKLRGLGIHYLDTTPGNIKIPGYEPVDLP